MRQKLVLDASALRKLVNVNVRVKHAATMSQENSVVFNFPKMTTLTFPGAVRKLTM